MEIGIVNKDDLESTVYLTVFLLTLKLPWSDITGEMNSVKLMQMRFSKNSKEYFSPENSVKFIFNFWYRFG